MNDPEIYYNANSVTLSDTKEVFNNYFHLIKWRPNTGDTILDIGCGPGNVTHNIMLPFLPSTFTKFVGADISKEMIEYAKKKFPHPKLEFCLIDISDTNMEKYFPNNERFDHIVSTYTLQWIANQKQVMKNIYNLLNPNGDCLLITLAYCSMYDAYTKLAEMEKWSKYMTDYKMLCSPYHFIDKKREKFENMLKFGGFKNYKVDILENRCSYLKGLTEIKNIMKSVNVFIHRIPINEQDEFIDDQITLQFPDVTEELSPNWNYQVKYSLIVAYASK